MNLFDGKGNKIEIDNGVSGAITPENTNFFEIHYPKYTNRFDGTYVVGAVGGDGNIISAVTSCATTDYIDISGGAYLYVGTKGDYTENPMPKGDVTFGAVWLCFYDTNKAIIGNRYSDFSAPVAIPNNAVYTRVTWQPYGGADNITNGTYFVGVVDSADAVAEWEPYYPEGTILKAYIKPENLTYKDSSPMDGKTWVLFGDSLTDGKDGCGGYDWTGDNWVSKIAREFGLIIDNRGKSGSNLCISTDSYATVSGIYMLDKFLAEIEAGTIEQPAYITIGFGGNCYNTYVGNAEDTSEKTSLSYYGATKYFIEKLREKCPNSVFGFVLPHDINWESNQSKQTGVPLCREAIKAVCDEYRVPYINMYTDSGITSDMLNDGVHIWNKQPMNLYYHAMRRFMMGL
jgi:lysophospholipase L1-like esterase